MSAPGWTEHPADKDGPAFWTLKVRGYVRGEALVSAGSFGGFYWTADAQNLNEYDPDTDLGATGFSPSSDEARRLAADALFTYAAAVEASVA
jgi:hypothetical protein